MIKQEDCILPISAPPLDDMLKDSVKKELYSWNDRPAQIHSVEKVLKPEYLNFLNLKWDARVIFCKKAGANDVVHYDPTVKQGSHAKHLPLAWAINWVYTGRGYHNFWDKSNVTHIEESEPMGHRGTLSYHFKFKTNLPPDISFYTDTSTPYIVNTHIPHQVHALTDRISFSLRATPDYLNMQWEEILSRLNAQQHV